MAAVPITITGIETRDDGSSGNVTIVGIASLTGLGVGGGPASPPLGIWPNPPEGIAPIPGHPIVLPPDLPPTLPPPDNRPVEWKTAWTEKTGWVVIGIPTGPTPTPSA